jgi:hypothetical protein
MSDAISWAPEPAIDPPVTQGAVGYGVDPYRSLDQQPEPGTPQGDQRDRG